MGITNTATPALYSSQGATEPDSQPCEFEGSSFATQGMHTCVQQEAKEGEKRLEGVLLA